MTIDSPPQVIPTHRPVAFLLATAISFIIGLSHFYAEFKPKAPMQNEYEEFLKQPVDVAGGSPSYEGMMESLRLTLSVLFGAIGVVNLIALQDAAPTLRKRASLVYCVAFACLGVLFRAHGLVIPGICLGVASICYLVDAVLTPRLADRIQ